MNNSHCSFVFAALVAAAFAASARGQMAVAIAADPARNWWWGQEDGYWRSIVADDQWIAQNTADLVRSTNELLVRLGRTGDAVGNAAKTIPASTASLSEAVSLPTRRETLATASGRYSLNQLPWNDKNLAQYDVAATYRAFGNEQKRDNARYLPFGAQQAMSDRFQTAAENAETVEAEELKVQAEAVERLRAAKTDAEIEVCNVAVAASKGRLDLAHAKVSQAKAELDEYVTKVAIAKERKAEADREWTEAIVSGLRQRALKAYQAQFGGSDDGKGS